ncbi:MAG: MFS transporter [Flavobacteriales bacterium]
MKNERILLVLLAAIQFTNIVDFMIMMPMGDILKKDLAIGPAKYGALVSSYGLAAGLTSLLGVFYLDYLDRKKALLFAYFGFILGTFSSAIIPTTDNVELNYYLFIGTRILTGITGGLLGGLVLSIVGDVIPLERRGRAMAVVTIAFSLASILGIPISLMLVDAFDQNWHVPFYFVSALSIPVWLLAFRFVPSLKAHLAAAKLKKDRLETLRQAFTTPQQRTGLLFTVLLVLGQFTVISFLTPYYVNNVGVAQVNVKYIYLCGGLATVVSGFLIGRAVDKVGRFRIFTIFALLSILPVIVVTHLEEVPFWAVLIIASFFFVFISGRMIPANTITSAIVPPQNRAGYMSLNSACMSLASGGSAILAGAIITQKDEFSPIEGYEFVGYIAIAATIASLFLIRTLKGLAGDTITKAADK